MSCRSRRSKSFMRACEKSAETGEFVKHSRGEILYFPPKKMSMQEELEAITDDIKPDDLIKGEFGTITKFIFIATRLK